MMRNSLKQIREECRLSIANFAACIGLKKATYQCYEDGTRKTPTEVMQRAQAQLERTRAYWAGMDQRIDERLKGQKMTRKVGECETCGAKANIWRCEEHYRCDDCGSKNSLCTYSEGVLCDPCHQKRVDKRISEFEGDTDYTQEITCPHCGYEYSDSWERDPGRFECPDCYNEFEVERNVEVTYSAAKL